jgi:hypothetical protein
VKSLRWLYSSAFVLSSVPSLAWAAEPSLVEWARRRVEEGIVKPLADTEDDRFSRSRPPPKERRVRVTQASLSSDKLGRGFVPFAIDVRFGSDWRKDDIVGCVYRASGEIYVKRGDQYRPAAFLLGKNVGPVSGVCEAAPPRA